MLVKIKSFLAALGGLMAALFAAYFLGRKDGRSDRVKDNLREEVARREMAAEGSKIDRETAQTPEEKLREELNKWAN